MNNNASYNEITFTKGIWFICINSSYNKVECTELYVYQKVYNSELLILGYNKKEISNITYGSLSLSCIINNNDGNHIYVISANHNNNKFTSEEIYYFGIKIL